VKSGKSDSLGCSPRSNAIEKLLVWNSRPPPARADYPPSRGQIDQRMGVLMLVGIAASN
jgi:hypothetical protein